MLLKWARLKKSLFAIRKRENLQKKNEVEETLKKLRTEVIYDFITIYIFFKTLWDLIYTYIFRNSRALYYVEVGTFFNFQFPVLIFRRKKTITHNWLRKISKRTPN